MHKFISKLQFLHKPVRTELLFSWSILPDLNDVMQAIAAMRGVQEIAQFGDNLHAQYPEHVQRIKDIGHDPMIINLTVVLTSSGDTVFEVNQVPRLNMWNFWHMLVVTFEDRGEAIANLVAMSNMAVHLAIRPNQIVIDLIKLIEESEADGYSQINKTDESNYGVPDLDIEAPPWHEVHSGMHTLRPRPEPPTFPGRI